MKTNAEDMWEGFEWFLKTQEVSGNLVVELREFQNVCDNKIK